MAESPPRGVTPLTGATSVRFHTVAEVAALIRVSKMSVYRLIHSGELAAVQFGRSFRVTDAALNAYLQRSFYDAG